jgi:probable O-glycosylation ligase (exosortase A-associated)
MDTHGLAASMGLTAIAAIGSQSRGALLAIAAMGFFLWLKSRHKLVTGMLMAMVIGVLAAVLPQSWYDRMNTIKTYQEDDSALGRINAWHTAFNVASDRITGGGFSMFSASTFRAYAPEPFSESTMPTAFISRCSASTALSGLSLFLLDLAVCLVQGRQDHTLLPQGPREEVGSRSRGNGAGQHGRLRGGWSLSRPGLFRLALSHPDHR